MDQDTRDRYAAGAVGLGLIVIGIQLYRMGDIIGSQLFVMMGAVLAIVPFVADKIYERFLE